MLIFCATNNTLLKNCYPLRDKNLTLHFVIVTHTSHFVYLFFLCYIFMIFKYTEMPTLYM